MNWSLIQSSLLVSSLTTALSSVVGLLAALWLRGLPEKTRIWWLGMAVAALCLPPFLVTNCWLHYFGQNGSWHQWVPFNIYSLGGAVWILTLLYWPITLLATLGAWQRLEAAQMESDPAVTGYNFLRGLLLPLARGAISQAAILTFALSLNNFAVPAILQIKVFPAEVWMEFNTNFNPLGAMLLSWPMVIAPLALVLLLRQRSNLWPHTEQPAPAGLFRQQLGNPWFLAGGILAITISVLSIGFPFAQLALNPRTWSELSGAVAAGRTALWNSLFYAFCSASLCLALGLAGWRWRGGWLLWLFFLIPGVVLGVALITVFNRTAFSTFYQSAGIVVLAFTLRYLAFAWTGVARARQMQDETLTEVARLNGASAWQMLRQVHWPQIAPQLAGVWYVIFMLCLWDVESMVLIVPPGGETLALRIFNLLHYGRNPQVNGLCLTLLLLGLAPLALWRVSRSILPKRKLAFVCLGSSAIFFSGCGHPASGQVGISSKLFDRVEIIGSRGVGIGQFNKPRSIVIDHQDNLYVSDWTGRIQKFSEDGRFLLSWQMAQTNAEGPKGMCCDKNGHIIIVEPHYQRINLYQTDGKLLDRWGEQGTNAGHFVMPRAIAINSAGHYFIPEYTVLDRVQEFTYPSPKLLRIIGHSGAGPGEFSRPEGLCVDKDDHLYVADSCNHRIQVFAADGSWLRSFGHAGNGPGEFSYPYDVQVDRAGRLYVIEFGNSRVQIFDAQDHLLEALGNAGGKAGEFSNPWCGVLDSHGNLYVADTENHRIQKFLRRKDVARADRLENREVIR